LHVLGFSNDDTDLPAAETGGPVSQQLPEESEKHKHALKIIVANGTVKDFLGKILTYEELDSLSPKQLKKYHELYTEEALSDSFFTK